MSGERLTEKYREIGVNWWDYCGPILVNSYPTYFEKLPPLIAKINKERRNSKNYVLFLGSTDAESNQLPCLSLIQFQIDDDKLVLSAYQRSYVTRYGHLSIGYKRVQACTEPTKPAARDQSKSRTKKAER